MLLNLSLPVSDILFPYHSAEANLIGGVLDQVQHSLILEESLSSALGYFNCNLPRPSSSSSSRFAERRDDQTVSDSFLEHMVVQTKVFVYLPLNGMISSLGTLGTESHPS